MVYSGFPFQLRKKEDQRRISMKSSWLIKRWAKEHWERIRHSYSKAIYFQEMEEPIGRLYEAASKMERLSEINYSLLKGICEIMGIKKRITWDTDYTQIDGKTERLVRLCKAVGATDYLSGPAARDYIEPDLFEQSDIRLHWMDYSGYPEYSQLYPPFEHCVSILDLLFHTGEDALQYMTGCVPK